MYQPSTPSVQVGPIRRRGSKQQKTASAAAAASLSCLPRVVLASILLGFPASDLRRYRRVCKEWRDVIADPVFIAAHMVHGPRASTHTVVFYPGRRGDSGGKEPLNGGGFLFDEQWRLTARFTVDKSVDMIGTSKGLLCFRDRLQGIINVVEPFSGESVALPLPPQGTAGTCSTRSYCFGFDAAARRYKIVYLEGTDAAASATKLEQELQVFTVGADKEWRTVRFSCSVHGVSYDFPASSGNGAVYWTSKTAGWPIKKKNVRFDLAIENITSVQHQVDGRRPEGSLRCRGAWFLLNQGLIGIKWFGEWKDGCWPHNVTAVAHDVYLPAPLREGRRIPGPHAMQRGHLLLQEEDGTLRANIITGSDMKKMELYVWFNVLPKLLIEIGSKDEDPAERNQFVPLHPRHSSRKKTMVVGRLPPEQCKDITTFAYSPTVSPTPFAMYLGTPLEDLCNDL